MPVILNLSKVDRARALKTWLMYQYHGLEVKYLASRLNVHPGTVSRVINGERTSKTIIEGLVGLGIPRELLPEPGRSPGRPPTE